MRVVLQRLLHHQRKAIKSLAHVGVAGSPATPGRPPKSGSSPRHALTTRASDDASTSAPMTIRSPPMSTISIRRAGLAAATGEAASSRVCDRHRQELDWLLPTDCVGSSLLTRPGEQKIGVDAIALGHLRHGPARREALGDYPTLLPRRPKTTLTHPRVYSLIRLIMVHR